MVPVECLTQKNRAFFHLHVQRQDVPVIPALGLELLDPIILFNPSEKLHLNERKGGRFTFFKESRITSLPGYRRQETLTGVLRPTDFWTL